MTITMQPADERIAAIPDILTVLPARARRIGGRNHEPHWLAGDTRLADVDYGALTFSARSTTPRTMVTFGRKRLTFSYISVKTRTVQQGEGPWEMMLAKHLEMLPHFPDYQLHGFECSWTDRRGGVRTYSPDGVWAEADGRVVAAEVKASAGYFAEPKTRALHEAAANGVRSLGVGFARVTGDALQEDRRRVFNVTRAFADRLTSFTAEQARAARDHLAAGDSPIGRVREIIGVCPSAAFQTVNAMMARSILSYDVSEPVNRDTLLRIVPEASPGRDIRRLGH